MPKKCEKKHFANVEPLKQQISELSFALSSLTTAELLLYNILTSTAIEPLLRFDVWGKLLSP